MKRIQCLSDAVRYFEHNDRINSVSFDVFDTLLARRVHPPSRVHQRVAERLSQRIPGACAAELLQLRYRVEKQLRQHASDQGYDHECHIDDWLAEWVRQALPEQSVNQAKQLTLETLKDELALERDALYAKPGALMLLQFLQLKKIPVVAISDMYLGAAHVSDALRALGLAAYIDAVYVSSETKQCKYSGRLFEQVLSERGWSTSQHCHIGDNLVSDVKVPKKRGMHALFLDEADDRARRNRLKRAYDRTMLSPSKHKKTRVSGHDFMTLYEQAPKPDFNNFYHRYGYNVLGPIYATFVQGLQQKIIASGCDLVCFLGRDGYIFQTLYERFESLSQVARPGVRYLYISRKVTFAALAFQGLRVEQARVGLLNPQQKGLSSILKAFNLPEALFEDLARQHGFSRFDEPIANPHDQRLIGFFGDDRVQENIKSSGEEHKDRLLKYLKQEGVLDAKRVALVDIGWNGTIQYGIDAVLESLPKRPQLHGFYFGLYRGIPYSFSEHSKMEGVMYDEKDRDVVARAMMNFEELFEESARSLEGSIIGYRDDCESGYIEPIRKPDHLPERQAENSVNDKIRMLQNGILQSVDTYLTIQRLTGNTFRDNCPVARGMIERALVRPTQQEVMHLSRLTHADDFGSDTTMDLSSINRWQSSICQPRVWLHELRRSYWQYGKLTGLFFNIPRWVFRRIEIRRTRKQWRKSRCDLA